MDTLRNPSGAARCHNDACRRTDAVRALARSLVSGVMTRAATLLQLVSLPGGSLQFCRACLYVALLVNQQTSLPRHASLAQKDANVARRQRERPERSNSEARAVSAAGQG